jgi:PII-like signaling protein
VSRNRNLPRLGHMVRCTELQLSIFTRAGDTFAGRPLYHEIIGRARCAGLPGATAVRGLQGFGASAHLRAPGLVALNGSEPVLIEIAGDPDRVRAFLSSVEQLVSSGIIVLKTVTVMRNVADVPDIAASAAT